ncbi:hypothetical protein HF086_004244, partial [Spodoptera exigua]
RSSSGIGCAAGADRAGSGRRGGRGRARAARAGPAPAAGLRPPARLHAPPAPRTRTLARPAGAATIALLHSLTWLQAIDVAYQRSQLTTKYPPLVQL